MNVKNGFIAKVMGTIQKANMEILGASDVGKSGKKSAGMLKSLPWSTGALVPAKLANLPSKIAAQIKGQWPEITNPKILQTKEGTLVISTPKGMPNGKVWISPTNTSKPFQIMLLSPKQAESMVNKKITSMVNTENKTVPQNDKTRGVSSTKGEGPQVTKNSVIDISNQGATQTAKVKTSNPVGEQRAQALTGADMEMLGDKKVETKIAAGNAPSKTGETEANTKAGEKTAAESGGSDGKQPQETNNKRNPVASGSDIKTPGKEEKPSDGGVKVADVDLNETKHTARPTGAERVADRPAQADKEPLLQVRLIDNPEGILVTDYDDHPRGGAKVTETDDGADVAGRIDLPVMGDVEFETSIRKNEEGVAVRTIIKIKPGTMAAEELRAFRDDYLKFLEAKDWNGMISNKSWNKR